MKPALIALENGLVFEGDSFGVEGETCGELVFNTSMTGYQEILTDPSYHGQIVTMTYPLIGNYGANSEDVESSHPQVKGFVVKEYSPYPSNWRCGFQLADYLKKHDIPAIQGVDTRMITRTIRDVGAMRAVLSTIDLDPDSLVEKARTCPSIVGIDLVRAVTSAEPYGVIEEEASIQRHSSKKVRTLKEFFAQLKTVTVEEIIKNNNGPLVVAFDYGIKENILRKLTARGLRVVVVPADTSADDVLKLNPDGIFLSNGPGDPAAVTYAIENVSKLVGKRPLFGICLGHQILSLALGGKTYKLKFGHRGANQPVMDMTTGKVEITSQNHGFAVSEESMKDHKALITHINLNDNTVEGLEVKSLKCFSMQYHPEASPGPHDSDYLFDRFVELIKKQ